MHSKMGVFTAPKKEKRALVYGGYKKCSILLFSGTFWVALPLEHISLCFETIWVPYIYIEIYYYIHGDPPIVIKF